VSEAASRAIGDHAARGMVGNKGAWLFVGTVMVELFALLMGGLVLACSHGGESLQTFLRRHLSRDPRHVEWQATLSAGRRVAAGTKPAFLFFDASWDGAGAELQHYTFNDPGVRALLADDFVPVYVDCTDEDEPTARQARDEFRVVGLPALIVVAPDFTTELARRAEFVDAQTLTRLLRTAQASVDGSTEPERL
jgi:thiol:disulfide interchange protein